MALEIIISILLFLGIILTAIPTVPGMLYMFVVVLVYGLVSRFEMLLPWHIGVFAGLVLLAILTDYISGLIGAKFGGAGKLSIIVGLVGMAAGFIFFPPFGLFAGLFAGVFIAELVKFKDHLKAFKAASYSFAGVIAGMIVNILLAIGFFTGFLVIVF